VSRVMLVPDADTTITVRNQEKGFITTTFDPGGESDHAPKDPQRE